MPRIPAELKPEIRRKHLAGGTSAEIATWLLAEHKVGVSDRAVRNLLAGERKDRAEQAKVIVREELQKELPADIAALKALRVRARKLGIKATKTGDLNAAIRALAEERQLIDTALYYSGAGEPDGGEARATAKVVVLPPESDE